MRERILVADPGLQRAYRGGRAALAVGLTLAVMIPLTRATGRPATASMLAVGIALASTVAMSGAAHPSRLRTAGMVWLAAAAAVFLGALLAPNPLASYAGFVAVMAAGAWAGGFGPRGLGVGLVAFMTYFYSLFTRASPGQLPWLVVAATVGAGIAAATTIVLLHDRPERRVRNLLVALRGRVTALTERVAGAPRGEADAEALERDAMRVDEVVLQLHDVMKESPEVAGDANAFRRRLFAVVTLSHFLVLRSWHEHGSADAALVTPPVDPVQRLDVHLEAMEAAVERRSVRRRAEENDPFRLEGDAPYVLPFAAAPEPEVPPAARLWRTGATRTAVQVAVAGVLSIGAGYLLSPQRWYWAAMSAYLVFVNTGSRGATLRKAVERMVGTAAGVAGGMLVGYLLAGQARLELILVFPLLFVAYWILPVSYATMVGTITILVALLYDLMGMLTADVLLLRLEETVLGAAVGTAVAYFVLPTRTGGAVDEAFGKYFAAMDALLVVLADGAEAPDGADARVLEAARELDRAQGALRAAVRPVVASVPGRRSRALRQETALAIAARFWIHRLAAGIVFHRLHRDAVDAAEARRGVDRLRARIRALREGTGATESPVDPGMPRSTPDTPLLRADMILAELARLRSHRR